MEKDGRLVLMRGSNVRKITQTFPRNPHTARANDAEAQKAPRTFPRINS